MESKPENSIFRFVAIRPPVPVKPKDEELNFIRDRRDVSEIPAIRFLQSISNDKIAAISEKIEGYTSDFNIRALNDNQQFLQVMAVYRLTNALTKKTFGSLAQCISEALGRLSAETFVKQTTDLRKVVWDYYYAAFLGSRKNPQSLDTHTQALRGFHLLDFIAAGVVTEFETMQKILDATPLVDKSLTDIPRLSTIKPITSGSVSTALKKEYRTLWNKVIDTNRAIEEIRKLRFMQEEITETVENEYDDVSLPESSVTGNTKPPQTPQREKTKLVRSKSVLYVNEADYKKLHNRTEALVKANGMDARNINMMELDGRLQVQLTELFQEVAGKKDYAFLAEMPAAARKIAGLRPIVKDMEYRLKKRKPKVPSTPAELKPLGIADLKVVKMRLKKYMPGEIAHIENVLRGELKERNIRMLERSESIFTESSEHEETQTRDTQTSEKLQLKSEAENTAESMMKIQAGTKVTATYGPVSMEVHGDFTYENSSKESDKNSSDFAREVINKTVSNIQKRIKEERVTKNLRETEEVNRHVIDNSTASDHTVGIYRWVDMLYESQLYNYGKRLMFQFIVPEPSAYYEMAEEEFQLRKKTEEADGLECPLPLPFESPDDIDESNYLKYVKDYAVEGVEPPPARYHTVTLNIVNDNKEDEKKLAEKSTELLVIPEGYRPLQISFGVATYFINPGKAYNFFVMIGSEVCWGPLRGTHIMGSYTPPDSSSSSVSGSVAAPSLAGGSSVTQRMPPSPTSGSSSITRRPPPPAARQPYMSYYGDKETILPVSIGGSNISTYALNVEVACVVTEEQMKRWKIKTFQAIQKAYINMKTIYDQKMAAKETGAGITITGKNPNINREIEKTELKKQCIRILMENCQGQKFGSFNAMKTGYTDFNIADAIQEGNYIQFFEQAFEWENMTYIFYPYFWSNQNEWIEKSTTYDTDPQFTKFLQSGSARVMLPARKGYENVVAHYLKTGAVWGGGDAPLADDPLFLAVADELKNQTDSPDNEKLEDSWEVVVPTTQVYLQQGSELPDLELEQ